MRLINIDHITINLLDIPRSIAFYQDVLGLPSLPSVAMEDHILHYFQLPGGCRLELIEDQFATRTAATTVTDRGTYRHLALQVDDLDALRRSCERFGAAITAAPAQIPRLGFRNMLVRDPNGVEIEFLERPAPGC
jgi:lactoylglutathione lyase